MLRLATYALGLLALAQASALAGEITDPKHTFRLTVPKGWTTEPSPSPAIDVVVASPRKAETDGSCNVVAGQDGSTASMSQSDLDAHASNSSTKRIGRTA